MSWSRVFFFASCYTLLFSSMPQWPGTQQKRTRALVTQWPEQVHDMANKRVLGVFTLNCLQTGHWVRVNYHIMMDWVHVFVIVQCQTYGCSLSCKDGAVVWQSYGQLAAGCLTILEMAIDDRRCPHFLFHFGAFVCMAGFVLAISHSIMLLWSVHILCLHMHGTNHHNGRKI